jgi:1-acyl-sn-glycerol-3-phosphate acyltransferase
LRGWRVGHAELALQHDVPVVPIAVIGSEEQWPQIGRIGRLHPFGAPYLPIPATPLPMPVHYHLHYGAPIMLRSPGMPVELHTESIERSASLTRAAVERLIREGRAARRGVFQ